MTAGTYADGIFRNMGSFTTVGPNKVHGSRRLTTSNNGQQCAQNALCFSVPIALRSDPARDANRLFAYAASQRVCNPSVVT